MRAYRHTFQSQVVWTHLHIFTNKLLFSLNASALAVRTSAIEPHKFSTPLSPAHTKCPFSNDDWCVRAFGWKKTPYTGDAHPTISPSLRPEGGIRNCTNIPIILLQCYCGNYVFFYKFSAFLMLKYAIYSQKQKLLRVRRNNGKELQKWTSTIPSS